MQHHSELPEPYFTMATKLTDLPGLHVDKTRLQRLLLPHGDRDKNPVGRGGRPPPAVRRNYWAE